MNRLLIRHAPRLLIAAGIALIAVAVGILNSAASGMLLLGLMLIVGGFAEAIARIQ